MSKKVVRTIAFQVNDEDFLKEYDQRQQESGLSVKNYFISLIKADIALHQVQADAPSQEEQDVGVPSVVFDCQNRRRNLPKKPSRKRRIRRKLMKSTCKRISRMFLLKK